MSRPDSIFGVVPQSLLPASYVSTGVQALTARDKIFQKLMEERKWPQQGWDDLTIESFLSLLASMDSNNFISKCGVGEREARIFSSIVKKRHFGMCHGLGRSGDLAEVQPKAVGSSLMSNLTNALLLDFCKTIVSQDVKGAFLCPMATGMSLTLILLALKREKPKAKFVVWPRIDQKSAFKSIITAGLEPLVVEGKLVEDEVQTNVDEVESAVKVYGHENILCVLTTTSCFAPRACDSLEEVSKICKDQNIFHVVNNAYGLQSGKCIFQIREGFRVGRLDVFVQSTDKNLMVPVGGAIIAGFNEELIRKIRQAYPGRASSSQTLDVFITLLSMGSTAYRNLLVERKENYEYLKKRLEVLAPRYGEEVIATKNNQISVGMTLSNIGTDRPDSIRHEILTGIGSMLFKRNVEGSRVVTACETKTIENHQFRGWGAHCSVYPKPYLTAAATIGMERSDVDTFIRKLEECLKKVKGRGLSATVEDP